MKIEDINRPPEKGSGDIGTQHYEGTQLAEHAKEDDTDHFSDVNAVDDQKISDTQKDLSACTGAPAEFEKLNLRLLQKLEDITQEFLELYRCFSLSDGNIDP